MSAAPDLRLLYRPLQPAAGAAVYTECLPDKRLQPLIYCYWQLSLAEALPYHYLVVADGCIDVFADLQQPEAKFVMGFCDQFTAFPLQGPFHYAGIRFLPAAFPRLFGISATALSNRQEDLADVVPGLSRYLSRYLHPGMDLRSLGTILDDYFLPLAAKGINAADPRFNEALSVLLHAPGTIGIEQDLSATGISSRHLRRLFDHYVGGTPKTFSKILRFQQLLRQTPSAAHLRASKHFFDLGYYDQSHFIKEFKSLYGLTPGKAFRP
jgi:AraC-like DNA-binding protein